MNKKLEFLLRKNDGKLHLQEYINELNRIINDKQYKILPLEETDIIMRNIVEKRNDKPSKILRNILYMNKVPLKECIKDIFKIDSNKMYVSLGYSNICGMVMIESILSFNINILFNDEHSGLIVIYDRNLENSVIIDSYGDMDIEYYDLEIIGNKWVM